MDRKRTLFFGVLIVAVGIIGWLAFRPDGGGGGSSMAQPDAASPPRGAPIVQVALPETLSPEAQVGKRGFEAKCIDCHGENAAGRDGLGPPLVHKIYEPSHHADAAFLLAAQRGVRSHHWKFGNMPPVEGVTRADVIAITTYVRELQRANGIN